MRQIGLVLLLAAASAAPAATPPTPAAFAGDAQALVADAFAADAPGVAVLVTRGDEVLYRGARGQADTAAGTALQPGDRFRIGSVTKQMAAAGVLALVDAGKVALEDPLSKYVPDYPGGAGITIEQLLNHTSGIRSYTDIPGRMDEPAQRDLDTAQMIDTFEDEPADFPPGERWHYNNSAYVLVGAVIEAASGLPWHAYLAQQFFVPLGMADTGYGADPAVVARQVAGYSSDGQATTPPAAISMTQPHAAGALVSTVDDLARWNRALHEGRLLKPETYARMIAPVGKAQDVGYGYGIEVSGVRGMPALQHRGGIPGFTAHLLYVQGPDVTVAVLHNSDSPSPAQDTAGLARRLAALAMGTPYPAAVPVAVDAAVLAQYEGVYRVDDTATRALRVVDGQMTVKRTDRPREPLTAIGDDTFLYADGFNRIRLERDGDGAITGMRFWSEGEGDGVVAPRTADPLPQPITLPRAALERFVGTYRMGAEEMHVTVEGDGLNGHIVGQPQGVTFVAMAPDRFAGDEVGAELVFAPASGAVQSVTLRQWGNDMLFERVADAE